MPISFNAPPSAGFEEDLYDDDRGYPTAPNGQEDDGVMSDDEINALFNLPLDDDDDGYPAVPGTGTRTGGNQNADLIEAARAQTEAARAQQEYYRSRSQFDQRSTDEQLAREQRTHQQTQLAAQRKASVDALQSFKPAQTAMSDAELDQIAAGLTPETRRYLDAVAQRNISQVWEQSVLPVLQQTQGEMFDMRQGINARPNFKLTAEDRIRLAHPDIDNFETNPAWHSFLDQREGTAGLTRRAVAQMAFERNDPNPLIALATSFKDNVNKQNNNKRPQATAHGAQVSEPQTNTQRGAGKKYPYSDYLAKREAYMTGQLAPDVYNKLYERVMDLDAQGLVDYNR